jgi:hypothetical protein
MIDEHYMERVQSKETVKKCKEFINELFIDNGGEKMKFVERKIYSLERNMVYDKEIHFLAEQSFSLKSKDIVNNINTKLEVNTTWKDHELLRYFKPECTIQVGQKVESLPDLEKLNGEKVIRSYGLEEGKVSLIFLWTIYKSISKKQLTYLNDLYAKNSWDSGVNFIAINTDNNRQYAQKLIKILNINRLDNLYIDSTKHPEHPLFNVTNKYGYPVCILVNNDNLIDFCGSLFEIDLEKKIKVMLERNLVSSTSFYPTNGLKDYEKKILKEIMKNIEHGIDDLKESLIAPHLCGFNLTIKKIYTAIKDNNFKNKQYTCELNYFCHSKDDKELEFIFAGIENLRTIVINKKYVETIKIKYGEYCYNCETFITDLDEQYYCNHCDIYFCKRCGDDLSEINFPDQIHPHFLYFLHKDNSHFMNYILAYNYENNNDFDFKYFQENKTKTYLNTVKHHYQVKCDGCLAYPIRTTRWKCCNCIFQNLCLNCKEAVENDTENAEDVRYNLKVAGCDPTCHVFMKIIFDTFVF